MSLNNHDLFTYEKVVKPAPEKLHEWETYSEQLFIEYVQCKEEGLDLEAYHDVFSAVRKMPKGNAKEAMADVLYGLVMNAKQIEGYAYDEPSDLEGIRARRKPHHFARKEIADNAALREKISGAWYGRICGCLLGKPVEGIHQDELVPFLKETGNYPMHRYIMASEITEEIRSKYKFSFMEKACADNIKCAPVDDDTNYVALAQLLIRRAGRDFTPDDVAKLWLATQPKSAYCTAERVAFRNFVMGYEPPYSAVYKNPYREWIGAQIRGDYFGYINPGDPEMAAKMAWRDASISHVKNGIYGEMFASAMIACAAVTDNIKDIILGGLAEIPATSRLYERVMEFIDRYESGVTKEEAFAYIHELYNDKDGHDWCHTISNALVVVCALLYGEGDYAKSICMAVETGFDTDCNGATVGSIIGMRNGKAGIGEYWTAPTRGILATTIFGVGKAEIENFVDRTMRHMPDTYDHEAERAEDKKKD
ncbi:MAG: ADP-ribosylglycohydrolase family protein [Clostridia bacterium]|nr:ADP-ribosylglycohydrolase family protein [Clostridia bacterium]